MKYTHAVGLAILLGAEILWPSISSATDYYAHANVGSDANSGLHPDDAFENLSFATRQLQPGDTLYLRAGTYHDVPIVSSRFHVSGTAASPITIKSYADEIATIRSQNKFVIQDLSWWVFEGFVFSSAPFKLGMDDTSLPQSSQCTSFAENITYKNIRFQHSSSYAITLRCARHIRIEDNIFDNLRSRIQGGDTHAIALQYNTDDVVISRNHFRDIGADGIQIHGRPGGQNTNIQITDNEFEIARPYRYRDENGNVVPADLQPFDNVGENGIDIKQGPGPIVISNNRFHGFFPAGPGQDASGGGSGITVHDYARGITISRNHFYNNVIHLAVGRGNHIEEYPDRDLVISNNIFDEESFQSDLENWILLGLHINSVSNVSILNNTFRTQLHDKAQLLRFNKLRNVTLFNNVFKNGRANIQYDGSMELIADHNAWSGILDSKGRAAEVDPVLSGIHDVVAADLKLDWATKRPLADSPLIDTALPVGITNDFNGAPVTGQGPDIGAVEYQQPGQGSEPDIQAPVVYISSPLDGDTVSGTVQVNVPATDNIGVNRVEFYIDDVRVATDFTAPYTFTWDSSTHAGNTATLKAIARDDAGNFASASRTVTINAVILSPSIAQIDSQALGATDSSGGGGCTINTSAKMDPVWLFLMLISAAGFIRQRLR